MSDEMKQELNDLKTVVADLKGLIVGLVGDVTGLKTDVAGLKTDVAGLKTITQKTAKQVAILTGDVAEIKETIATKMVTKDEFSTLVRRMDGFAGKLDDTRWDWAKHTARLDDHELRLTRLEQRDNP